MKRNYILKVPLNPTYHTYSIADLAGFKGHNGWLLRRSWSGYGFFTTGTDLCRGKIIYSADVAFLLFMKFATLFTTCLNQSGVGVASRFRDIDDINMVFC